MIRTLKTWCLYVPGNRRVIGFYPTKKAAVERDKQLAVRSVIVPMKGTYAWNPKVNK